MKTMTITQQTKCESCDGWFYEYDSSGWTIIMEEDGNIITKFFRTLSYEEVYAFKAGWKCGHDTGIKAGKAMKAVEIRQALGL